MWIWRVFRVIMLLVKGSNFSLIVVVDFEGIYLMYLESKKLGY